MGKYDPLSARLAADPAAEWRASFSELESVLGFPLPKAARVGRAWWADDPAKSHSRAWMLHGWTVDEVDHAGEQVMFRRGGAAAAGEDPPPATRQAGDAAATRRPVAKGVRTAAITAAGLAVVVGVGAMLARAVRRRQ